MALSPSPLAPSSLPELPAIAGVRLGAADAQIRYKDRPDLLLVELAAGTQAAGVLTRSLTCSAPVDWCRAALAKGRARGLVVNAGNANAFTGKAGIASVQLTADAAAQLLGAEAGDIFIASTGVIGEKLPDAKIMSALPKAAAALSSTGWPQAARAIMTTDTFPKLATRTARIGGVEVRLNGIAKGSGMIAPDMATMLAFVFTDAAIAAPVLQMLLAQGCNRSFNAITVDGDTSTSDTLLLFATAQAKHTPITSGTDPALGDFRRALEELLIELAQLIVRDGEGATRFVEIRITGAEHDQAARRIGLAIGNSPLVKTALAAGDANWGRIVAAIGKSGERAERDKLTLTIGGVLVAANGEPHPDYHEAQIATHMQGQNISIEADVGVGKGEAAIWTCDLTHAYIDINGSYRT